MARVKVTKTTRRNPRLRGHAKPRKPAKRAKRR